MGELQPWEAAAKDSAVALFALAAKRGHPAGIAAKVIILLVLLCLKHDVKN